MCTQDNDADYLCIYSLQIVLGSFNSGGKKEPKKHAPSEPTSVPLKVGPTTGMGPNSPPSRGTLSESSGGAGSPPPLHQGMAASNNNQPPFVSSMPWKWVCSLHPLDQFQAYTIISKLPPGRDVAICGSGALILWVALMWYKSEAWVGRELHLVNL